MRIPQEHREYLAEVFREKGPRNAAMYLGIGRTALLGILARGECMPGTAALVREAVARRAAA